LFLHNIATGCLQQNDRVKTREMWMGMSFVLSISLWSSVAVTLVSLSGIDSCGKLSDVIIPLVACPVAFPEKDTHLRRATCPCQGQETSGILQC
jgi:hypothetical protein